MRRFNVKFWIVIQSHKSSPRFWTLCTKIRISAFVPPSMISTWVCIFIKPPLIKKYNLKYVYDLEWRHGRGGHLTLQDEDLTTRAASGWRKLNTLAHYGIKDSAVMSLVARPNDSYSNTMSLCKKPCNYHTCKSPVILLRI